MKDELIEILDSATKISVLCADATTAAGQLARGHLSGPTASHYLAEALAGVALLGAETAQEAETVTFRLNCPGPLEGFLVECTAAGTLRGYTKKKILNDFDGLGAPKDAQVLGGSGTFEIIRSIPGAILSSGTVATAWKEGAVAAGLDAYFDQSLQRRVRTAVAASVSVLSTPSRHAAVLVAIGWPASPRTDARGGVRRVARSTSPSSSPGATRAGWYRAFHASPSRTMKGGTSGPNSPFTVHQMPGRPSRKPSRRPMS